MITTNPVDHHKFHEAGWLYRENDCPMHEHPENMLRGDKTDSLHVHLSGLQPPVPA